LVKMSDGISKVLPKGEYIYFVSLHSHLKNVSNIAKSFSPLFSSKKDLLMKAANYHDRMKEHTFNPYALMDDKKNLFPRHSRLPDHIIDPSFNEFEIDREIRIQNLDNYYVLGLVRSHHSGFNYSSLLDKENILEAESVREELRSFITDWYALMTADWIDSRICECVFRTQEIPSLVDLGVYSEVELCTLDDGSFRIVQDNILESGILLLYDYVSVPRRLVEKTLKQMKRQKKPSDLMNILDASELQSQKVELVES